MTKKQYEAPVLQELGSVEKMTQAFGNSAINDTVYIGSTVFGHGLGSKDGHVVQ